MPTKIGKILIRSVQFLFLFLCAWAGIASITAYPLYWIFGDSPTLVRSLLAVSFLATCYGCWALHRYVKTSAQLKADREKWNMREFKRERRETGWGQAFPSRRKGQGLPKHE